MVSGGGGTRSLDSQTTLGRFLRLAAARNRHPQVARGELGRTEAEVGAGERRMLPHHLARLDRLVPDDTGGFSALLKELALLNHPPIAEDLDGPRLDLPVRILFLAFITPTARFPARKSSSCLKIVTAVLGPVSGQSGEPLPVTVRPAIRERVSPGGERTRPRAAVAAVGCGPSEILISSISPLSR
jgi:hypothetical protein